MADISPIVLRIQVSVEQAASVDKLSASLARVRGATDNATKAAQSSAKAAQLAGSRWGGWNDMLSRFQRRSWAAQAAMTFLKTAGRSLLGVFNELTDVAKDLTDKWGAFELALVRSAGAIGIVDRTSALFDDLKQGIYDARRELGFFESSEIASALYKWGAAMGVTIKTADDLKVNMSAVKAIMKVAAINFEDFETVMLGVTSALNTFNLPISKAADVAALFSYAAMGSAASVSDLVTSMKYVGPIAKNMGESVSSVFDVLMSLADAGIKGSQAGTSLRRTYSMLIKPTKAVKAGLQAIFGSQSKVTKALYNSKGGFKGLANMAWQVAKATKGMTNEQRLQLVSQIAQQTNMPALISLVDKYATAQDKGAKSLSGAQDMQKTANESLQKQWELLQGTWVGTVNQLKGAVEPVLLEIGNILAKKFTPALKDAAKWVTEVAEPWVRAHPDLVEAAATIGAITAAVTGLSGALLLFSGTVGNVAMSGLGAMFNIVKALAVPLASLATTVLPAVATAIMSISWPVWLVIGAIAAFVAAYTTNFGGFRDFVDGLVAWLISALPGAIDAALSAISGFVNGLLSPIIEKLPAIISFLQGIVDSLAENWVPVFEHIATVAGEVFTTLQTVIGEVVAQVMEHVGPLVDQLAKLGSVIYEFIGPAWNFLVTVVGAVFGAIIKAVVEFLNMIAPYVQGFVDLFLRGFGIVAEFVVRTVGNFASTVIDVIKGFVRVITGIIEVFTGLLTGNWDRVWQGLGDVVGGFVDAVAGVIRGFVQLVGDIIRTGLQVVTGVFEFVFGAKPGSILAGIGSFIATATKNIGGFIDGIVKTVTGLPGQMVDAGKNIVKGLWDGISSLGGWLTDKIWSWVKSVIPGPVLDALGIHSPSRVMADIGVNIVKGLAKGIDATTAAEKAMQAKSEAIIAAANVTASGLGTTAANFSGDFSRTVAYDSRKEITIHHEITSPDGSVANVDINTLADLLTTGMTKTLERMATVD